MLEPKQSRLPPDGLLFIALLLAAMVATLSFIGPIDSSVLAEIGEAELSLMGQTSD